MLFSLNVWKKYLLTWTWPVRCWRSFCLQRSRSFACQHLEMPAARMFVSPDVVLFHWTLYCRSWHYCDVTTLPLGLCCWVEKGWMARWSFLLVSFYASPVLAVAQCLSDSDDVLVSSCFSQGGFVSKQLDWLICFCHGDFIQPNLQYSTVEGNSGASKNNL